MTDTQVWTIISIALANIGTTVALFIWASTKTDAYRDENRDFHGRMCTLEERYMQMMQRILEKKGK